ncbi:hypothetical protein DH2020_023456 [Rehmannia glutinosa]|uniref:eRF1 domain-containing protein n=1 Tax=Rehmannia glutinosa TaxID=99300 RepID=A0ABR0W639_REHGL
MGKKPSTRTLILEAKNANRGHLHAICAQSSGHSLREVLDAPNVMNMIKETEAAQEVRVLKDFFAMLSNDPERVCYGPKHVEVAHERMVVQTLLITDELFRKYALSFVRGIQAYDLDNWKGITRFGFDAKVQSEAVQRKKGLSMLRRVLNESHSRTSSLSRGRQ